MDNMTKYLTIAIVISAFAAMIGNFLNNWIFAKRRKRQVTEPTEDETNSKKSGEPNTDRLSEIPSKYAQLKIIKGDSPGFWILDQPKMQIGRSVDADIYLEYPTVSRNHAFIERKNGKFFISDRGSRNGTIVNGKKIEKALELHDGDFVDIGQLKLIFSMVEVDKSG